MLIPFDNAVQLIDVADIAKEDTKYKQKVKLEGFSIDFHSLTNEVTLVIKTRVYPFAKKGNGYGASLEGNGIQSYPVILVANNYRACYFNPDNLADARNGEVVSEQGSKTKAVWDAELAALPIPILRQGDFYKRWMFHPAMINQMLVAEVARANTTYKFGGKP